MQKQKIPWLRWLFLLLGVLPPLAGLIYSLLYSIGGTGALSTGWTARYWVQLLEEKGFWAALSWSAAIAISVSLLSSGIAIGLVLGWKNRLDRPNWSAIMSLPLFFPPMVAAFIGYQWLSSSGIIARMAFCAGWIQGPEAFPAIVNSPNQLGLVLTLLTFQVPLFVLVCWYHYTEARVSDFQEQASALGATGLQAIRTIAVPILWNRMKPTMVIYGVFLFGAYEIPLVLGQQYPGMLSVFLHQKFKRYDLFDIPVAYAGTFIYALVVLASTLYFFKTLQKEEQNK